MVMKRDYRLIVALLGVILPISMTAAEEQAATDLASAITSGKVTIGGRYRYEHVNQDNALDNANASTLRLRLNYRTGAWNGWSGFAEFDHVFHVLIDDFNSGEGTSPNRSQYSVVADPKGSDLNQLYFEQGVSKRFNHPGLKQFSIEGYAGFPLMNAAGDLPLWNPFERFGAPE